MSKATTAERALNRKGGTMSRLIKTLFGFYPVLLPLVVVGVVLCAIINSIGATFLQSALQIISESWQSGDWEAAQPKIAQLVTTLACIYGVGILSSLFWNRAMAIVTQGSLGYNKVFHHFRLKPQLIDYIFCNPIICNISPSVIPIQLRIK